MNDSTTQVVQQTQTVFDINIDSTADTLVVDVWLDPSCFWYVAGFFVVRAIWLAVRGNFN